MIDMIRQSFFVRRLWRETKKSDLSGFKINFSEFFSGKYTSQPTDSRFAKTKKKIERDAQIYLYRDLKLPFERIVLWRSRNRLYLRSLFTKLKQTFFRHTTLLTKHMALNIIFTPGSLILSRG